MVLQRFLPRSLASVQEEKAGLERGRELAGLPAEARSRMQANHLPFLRQG